MTSRLFLILLFLLPGIVQAISVRKATCEMTGNPLMVTVNRPRLGWQLESSRQGDRQTAYAIELWQETAGGKLTIWNSGKVLSSQSQAVSYAGTTPLQPGELYCWRVQVWDSEGQPSAWSGENSFRMAPASGFLDAEWIGAIRHEDAHLPQGRKFHSTVMKKPENKAAWAAVDTLSRKSICLRKEFQVERPVKEATVYVCGLGHYELSLNGDKVGDGEFTPMWSDYEKSVYYNAYDVTNQLQSGNNAFGVILGNGFYNVQGGRYRKLQISFGAPTLFLKMVVRYEDGSTEIVRSDADWQYDFSPITFNCIYGGEDYDARREQEGWNRPGFDARHWRPVVVQTAPKGELRPQLASPVKIMEHYGVKTSRYIDSLGVFVLDMGQNLSGFPEIAVRGKKGDKVRLTVGESLAKDGTVSQKQTGRHHYYEYTLKGTGEEIWHPRFSYYGFRYIQVEGAVLKGAKNPARKPVLRKISSCFVYNSAPAVSEFECSNTIFNQAHRLIHQAVRSNMQAVFTDCPHREKLGWLEQIHLNGPGLFYNYDLTHFVPKIMQDMSDAQHADGLVPSIAPEYVEFGEPFGDSPEWGSSVVLLPFMYYDYYGDSSLITTYYPTMRRYTDYLGSRADHYIVSHGLGDWYDYGDFRAGFSRNTPVPLVATAHYYQDLLYMTRAARMVGNRYDEQHYAALAEEVRQAFNRTFFNDTTGQYGSGSQCSNALPLFLNMTEPQDRKRVVDNLITDIKAHGNRLTTGDVGNRYLFQTLARNGLNELMYTMHNHEEAPGYGFQLKFGATTLTEQWDPRQGASWNHFMMGQIDEWFFYSLAGIRHQETRPGFQQLVIQPQPVGDLKYVHAVYQTLYGEVAVDWKHTEQGNFILDVEIPVNCEAEVYLPGAESARRVGSGKHHFE